jgi:V/A-type H+-transporting ATPase subunit D
MLSAGEPPKAQAQAAAAIDPSPEAKACRAAFERLLWVAADIAARAGNLNRVAREYRRIERRAKALEKVLLPELEVALKYIDEQLDMMEREETIRTRWSHKAMTAEEC